MNQANWNSRKRNIGLVWLRSVVIAIAVVAITVAPSFADPFTPETFFGEDLGPLENTNPRPNSEIARLAACRTFDVSPLLSTIVLFSSKL